MGRQVEVVVPEGRVLADLNASLVEFLVALLLAHDRGDPLLGIAVRHLVLNALSFVT